MIAHIDLARSRVEFSVRHLMITTVRGRFTDFAGDVVYDVEEPVLSSVEARIRVSSITTGDRERDAALLSADFLNVAAYPEIVFRSRRIQPLAADRGRLTGDLTIRDLTRRVTLEARLLERTDDRARIAATTAINRKEWGLTWGPALETAGVLVGDEITVSLLVEIVEE